MMNEESKIKDSINQLDIFLLVVVTLAYFQRCVNADRVLTRCLYLKLVILRRLNEWNLIFGSLSQHLCVS